MRLTHLLDCFHGAAPTRSSVLVRLASFEAVQMLTYAVHMARIQAAHTTGALWAIRSSTVEDRLRTALVSDAVRLLQRGSPVQRRRLQDRRTL